MSFLLYACILEYLLILYFLHCLLNKAPVETKTKTKKTKKTNKLILPRKSAAFHLVGQCDFLAKDVVLPAYLTQYTPQYRAAVYAHSHVDVALGPLLNLSANRIPCQSTWRRATTLPALVTD